jgi:hypothetical protein
MIKLMIQSNNFAYEYELPITLGKGDCENYLIIRDNFTGGLSNTHQKLSLMNVKLQI